MPIKKKSKSQLKTKKVRIYKNKRSKFPRILMAALITSLVLFAGVHTMRSFADDACTLWAGETPLDQAINLNGCLEIQPGTYKIAQPIPVFGNKTVKGVAGMRDQTVLVAAEGWVTTVGDAVLNVFTPGSSLKLSEVTIDGNTLATYGLASLSMNIDNVRVRNGACAGIGITGKNFTVSNSIVEKNGYRCGITVGVVEGAGIYGEVIKGTDGKYDRYLNPVISNNTIENNFGPGLDINGVWGGTFSKNKVQFNSDWAGVSLYGASYWNVADNSISHPATNSYQKYHPYCAGGPYGKKSAALILCQDTEYDGLLTNFNTVTNNKTSSNYGILVIGADEKKKWYAPRLNTFTGNDITGSYYPCSDDFKVGQWYKEKNYWSKNKCGTYNNMPVTF